MEHQPRTRDFQTGILIENAKFVFFGPYLQYFVGTMDLIANWILENRGRDPGIESATCSGTTILGSELLISLMSH